MRKVLLSLLFAVFAASLAPAQGIGQLGARLSGTITNPSGKHNNLGVGGGFDVGLVYQIPLVKKFYLEPGLLFYYTSMGTDDPVEYDGKLFDASVRNLGLAVPVNFGYHFNLLPNLKLSAFTGPRFNFNISSKEYYSPNFEVPAPPSVDLFDLGWKKFDLQWGFGIGFTVAKSYFIGVSGDVAVTPLAKYGNKRTHINVYRNTFAITLGYNF